jgi:hypothetical protein
VTVVFEPEKIVISLDEFSGLVAPALFLAELQAISANVPVSVGAKKAKDGAGTCVVAISQPVPPAQQPAVLAAIAAHNPTSVFDAPDQSVAELNGGPGFGRIRYVKRAPKATEADNAGTGTLVYKDHLGNWRRVSDDAILKAAP